MGEETQTTEIRPKPVDPTLFRRAQQDLSVTAVRPDLVKEVLNEDIKKSIGTDGEVDETLFNTVDEYVDVMKEPYSVKYFKAKEVFNGLTEKDFESIDEYILDKIKASNQKTTFEVYNKLLAALEDVLGLSEDHETMHRIVQTVKFIEHGKQ